VIAIHGCTRNSARITVRWMRRRRNSLTIMDVAFIYGYPETEISKTDREDGPVDGH
jgi:hypothetical protein